MYNLDIRKAIEDSDFKYWQVANKLKMTDGNFSRLLRVELDESNKNKILNAIKELKEEREKWNQMKQSTPRKM